MPRAGATGVEAIAAPALLEPAAVLFEYSAITDALVRQLLTPPPADVEPPPAASPTPQAKGAKVKPAAPKVVKAGK